MSRAGATGGVIPPGRPEPFELPVGGLVLRQWREQDVDALWAAFQDPELRRWNGGHVASRTDALVLLGRRMDWTSGDHASWALVDPEGDDLLASVSLHTIDRLQGNAEIGYWTVPAARGRGLAAAAVDVVCRWALGALPVDRVELCHAVDNPASGRVAEKAGFTCEGRLRRSVRYGDGVKHDELLWARLADDPPPELSTRS